VIFKGYLNFLEKAGDLWTKVWITIRRPYILIYDHEDDPVERMIINISFVKVLYSEDQAALFQVRLIFFLSSLGFPLEQTHLLFDLASILIFPLHQNNGFSLSSIG